MYRRNHFKPNLFQKFAPKYRLLTTIEDFRPENTLNLYFKHHN